MWHDIHPTAPFVPFELKIEPQRMSVSSGSHSDITDAEVAGHRAAIFSDPDFNPAFNEVVDFTFVTDVDLSESTLAALAQNPSLFHDSVFHIVVAPADVLFQIASKYKAFARISRPNLFVVRTRDEAYQLLSTARGPG